MKKTTKKLLALCLAGVMALGLVGCGNGGETTTTPDPTQAPATNNQVTNKDAEKPADPTATPEPTPVTYDFGGVTVKCYGSEWNGLDGEDPIVLEAKAYVEKKYNIKLEKAAMEGYDGYNDDDILISSIAAGDPAAHIICLNPESSVTCFTNDILFDLTPYLDQLQVGSAYTDVATWQGKVFGVAYENIGDAWVMVYDRDYLKEIGMEKTPTDMFMEGKWDYESCKAYLAEMKSKLPDGVYPIGNYWSHWGYMAPAANGQVVVDDNGKLHLADEAIIEATQFYMDLKNEGLAFPCYLERTADGTIATNEDGSQKVDYAYAVTDERIVLKRAEVWQLGGLPFENYGIVFWPWGSNVTCEGDYTTLSDEYKVAGAYWGFDAIVKDATRVTGIPGEVLAMICQDFRYAVSDKAYIHDAWVAEQAGNYENVSPEEGEPRSFSTEQDVELFDWGHTRYQADYSWAFNSAGIARINRAFQDIFMENKDVRSTMESYVNEADAKLQELGLK